VLAQLKSSVPRAGSIEIAELIVLASRTVIREDEVGAPHIATRDVPMSSTERGAAVLINRDGALLASKSS
jgi:hypothetical protein